MARKAKPERADVCIIGAGASGAAAAKVLTERGLRVVGLERGPWRTKETFGGDELANVNRYNLWPDPLLNPRTVRTSADEEARIELFCPVPQMVGGGTVHWQGWLPRFTGERLPATDRHRRPAGRDARRLAYSYADLEPYYDKVEWAFGVSGAAGANVFESPRTRGYPCPPMPMSRYAQKFHAGCAALGYNSFPTPQAALSRPFNGRPATVISAFAQQHGDPTGTRSSALNVFVPDAAATGRYDLRPDSYVRELTVDARGRAASAVYADADGDLVEQEADVFVLACGAVESARLLLLSRSSGSRPAWPTAATWSGATSRSTSTAPRSACSTIRSTPGPAAGTSAPAASSSTSTMTPVASPAAVTSPAPASASPCRSTGACRTVRCGGLRPSAWTGSTSTTAWPLPWSCTTCRSTTTASTSTRR
jgi:choline dehydrogenase-like flavoprotein